MTQFLKDTQFFQGFFFCVLWGLVVVFCFGFDLFCFSLGFFVFEKNKVAYFLWEIEEDVRSHSV